MVRLDQSLITDAQILANGRYVHKVANFIAAYQTAYGFYLDSPDNDSIKLFQEAEKQLIKFIAVRRMEQYRSNISLQKGLENIRAVRKVTRQVAGKK